MLGQGKYHSGFVSFIFVYKSFKLQVFVFTWVKKTEIRKKNKTQSGSGDF